MPEAAMVKLVAQATTSGRSLLVTKADVPELMAAVCAG
jgi:hypothetical protein